jgi:hypothetical protein
MPRSEPAEGALFALEAVDHDFHLLGGLHRGAGVVLGLLHVLEDLGEGRLELPELDGEVVVHALMLSRLVRACSCPIGAYR